MQELIDKRDALLRIESLRAYYKIKGNEKAVTVLTEAWDDIAKMPVVMERQTNKEILLYNGERYEQR